MDEARADLHMLNVVAADLAASLDFYRRLGSRCPTSATTRCTSSCRSRAGSASRSTRTARPGIWHAGFRADPAGVGVVLGSPPAVERRRRRTVRRADRGRVHRAPASVRDAFWGARYAIVADPDGNDVGLMGPIEDARRFMPPVESPDP